MLWAPLLLADLHKASDFPAAVSAAFAYEPGTGYIPRDPLRLGIGYWLKVASGQSGAITGATIAIETVLVNGGWNVLRLGSDSMNSSAGTSDAPAGVRSSFFAVMSGRC